MRGFPVFNLLVALIVSGAVVLPLVWRSTMRVAAVPAAQEQDAATPADRMPSHVSLRFVHPPAKARLMEGDTVLHEWTSPDGMLLLEDTVALPWSDDRVAFALRVEWPAGTPESNNVVMRVEPEKCEAWKDVFFSDSGVVDEIIEFTCKP